MPRGSFNTTADIYSGPGSATPGVLVGTFSVRHVVEDAIFLAGVGSPIRTSYMTIAGYSPVPTWTANPLGVNAELADQIAIPSGTAVQSYCLLTESVSWRSQPLYFRAHLVSLPLPPHGQGPPGTSTISKIRVWVWVVAGSTPSFLRASVSTLPYELGLTYVALTPTSGSGWVVTYVLTNSFGYDVYQIDLMAGSGDRLATGIPLWLNIFEGQVTLPPILMYADLSNGPAIGIPAGASCSWQVYDGGGTLIADNLNASTFSTDAYACYNDGIDNFEVCDTVTF